MSKHVHWTKNRSSRLANVRVRIEHDDTVGAPWRTCETVYVPVEMLPKGEALNAIDIHDKYGSTYTFATSHDFLKKLVGVEKEQVTEELMDRLWAGERCSFYNYLNDRVWTLLLEKWNDAERQFDVVDHLYGAYDLDEVCNGISELLDDNKIDEDGVIICCDSLKELSETMGTSNLFTYDS